MPARAYLAWHKQRFECAETSQSTKGISCLVLIGEFLSVF